MLNFNPRKITENSLNNYIDNHFKIVKTTSDIIPIHYLDKILNIDTVNKVVTALVPDYSIGYFYIHKSPANAFRQLGNRSHYNNTRYNEGKFKDSSYNFKVSNDVVVHRTKEILIFGISYDDLEKLLRFQIRSYIKDRVPEANITPFGEGLALLDTANLDELINYAITKRISINNSYHSELVLSNNFGVKVYISNYIFENKYAFKIFHYFKDAYLINKMETIITNVSKLSKTINLSLSDNIEVDGEIKEILTLSPFPLVVSNTYVHTPYYNLIFDHILRLAISKLQDTHDTIENHAAIQAIEIDDDVDEIDEDAGPFEVVSEVLEDVDTPSGESIIITVDNSQVDTDEIRLPDIPADLSEIGNSGGLTEEEEAFIHSVMATSPNRENVESDLDLNTSPTASYGFNDDD